MNLLQVDWITLFWGIFLGVRFTNFRDNRKLLKKAKTRQQALQVFERIKAFKEGKRDRYPFYMLVSTGAVVAAQLSCTLVILISVSPNIPFEASGLLGLSAFGLAIIAFVLCLGLYETARQIERFDEYKAEFEQRWGAE